MLLRKPAFQIDISWRNLVRNAAAGCLPNVNAAKVGQQSFRDQGVEFFDSVRAGFITLLKASVWPRGAEIIFTVPTIDAMPRLAEALGYVAVTVDCSSRFHPATVNSLRRCITSKTRAIVVAPLFGCRLDLHEYRALCDEHGLTLIEDAAQAYPGSGIPTRGAAHCAMFSFGILKRATSLGGAIVLFEQSELQKRCEEIHFSYPIVPQRAYFKRWALGLLGKCCTSNAFVYSALDRVAKLFGRRLPLVLLSVARPKKAFCAVERYLFQPHPANINSIIATLRRTSIQSSHSRCCQQQPSITEHASVGLWPRLVLKRSEDVVTSQMHGHDLVSIKVRLVSVKSAISQKSLENCEEFLRFAYFVHPSFFHKNCGMATGPKQVQGR